MSETFKDSTVRHGTPSGYRKHQYLREDPCPACYSAKAEYDRNWRAAPSRTRLSRLHAKAQNQALRRLAKLHPEEYSALYAEEKERAFNEAGEPA